MYDRRASGVLLHPTSLPGSGGIGDLGDAAYRFVDWLAEAKQRRWQIMPLGPTSYGDSPYAGLSALAGNPLLISLDPLVEEGILERTALENTPTFPAERVDFGPVIEWKMSMLQQAFGRFSAQASTEERAAFVAFSNDQANWLDNYALFAAVKKGHGGGAWDRWGPAIPKRQPHAVAGGRE